MSPAVAQRSLVLAAVALLAATAALALSGGGAGRKSPATAGPAAAGGWYEALAGARSPAASGVRTACGKLLTPGSLGVSHPVLPCGERLVVAFGGVEVQTTVIDRSAPQPGRQLELTAALAQRLGVKGTQRIRWRLAEPG